MSTKYSYRGGPGLPMWVWVVGVLFMFVECKCWGAIIEAAK